MLVTMRLLTQFQPKIRASNLTKSAKFFVLLVNSFSDLFAVVESRYRGTFKFAPRRFLER